MKFASSSYDSLGIVLSTRMFTESNNVFEKGKWYDISGELLRLLGVIYD